MVVQSDTTLAADAAMQLQSIHYQYGKDTPEVIHDISLTVAKGEVLSIVGPSGCGKSTLLRMMANLASPTQGHIGMAQQERDCLPVAMVFQQDVLLPWMTVDSNIKLAERFAQKRGRLRHMRYGLRRARTSQGDDQDASSAADLLKMVGLAGRERTHPRELSGGMRRRVAVVQALAPLPAMLLLDEPFSAVDEPTRIGIHQDVRDLICEVGVATVLVTHDVAEAVSLSDRVVVLTDAPARVAKVIDVPLGRRRVMRELRESQQFLETYAQVWEVLNAYVEGKKAS